MIYRVVMDGSDILDYRAKGLTLLNPTLNLELNTAGSLEFTMPPGHLLYDAVRPLLSTIEVYEGDNLLWFGRPVEVSADFWKQRRIYCEGALSFLNDSVQRPLEYEMISLHRFFQTVIANHNTQVAAERQFTVGTVTVADHTVYRKLNYDSTFDVLKRQCLNAEGGYLFVRREGGINYLDWLSEMPYVCNQPVEFGLNLLNITSSFNGASIATCVVPLGEPDEETGEELTVASVNGGSDTVESDAVSTYGRITRAVTFPGVKEASTLYADALEYLQNTQFNNLVIECSAAELHAQNPNYEPFRVGQMIHCRSVPHLVDRDFPLMKLSLRLDTAAKQITLGTVGHQTLSRIYKETKPTETVETIRETSGEMSQEVEEALDDLSGRIDGLEELINDIPADNPNGVDLSLINELQGGVDDLSGRIDDLEELINEISVDSPSGGNQTAINELQGSVENLRGGLDNMRGSMDSIRSDLNNVDALINGIVDGSNDGWGHWFGTSEEYRKLGSYDNHTIYFIQSSEMIDNYFIYNNGEL